MKIIFIALLLLLTSGCAGMVEMAAKSLAEMQDTNRYEEIRESVGLLCNTSNYDMFVDQFGKATVDKWMNDVCNPATRKN